MRCNGPVRQNQKQKQNTERNSFEFYLGEALNMQKIICGFIASDGCRFIRAHTYTQTNTFVYNFIMHLIIHSSANIGNSVVAAAANVYMLSNELKSQWLKVWHHQCNMAWPVDFSCSLSLFQYKKHFINAFDCDKNGNIHPSSNNTNLTVIIHSLMIEYPIWCSVFSARSMFSCYIEGPINDYMQSSWIEWQQHTFSY